MRSAGWAVAVVVLGVACGGSPPPVVVAPTRLASEASPDSSPSEVRVPATGTDDDGWQHFERRPVGSVPPEPDLAAVAPTMPGVDPVVATAYQELLALGYPALASASLREVELEEHDVWGASETFRTRALVTRAADGGPPWALLDGVYWPVLAMGPELSMGTECVDGLDRVERLSRQIEDAREADLELGELLDALRAAQRICPTHDAWPLLAARGEDDAVPSALRTTTATATVGGFVNDSLSYWLRVLYEHAITHHMQGQIGVALWDTRRIVHVLELASSGAVDPGDTRLYGQMGELHQDLERRHAAAPRSLPTLTRGCPVAPASIPALVDALDEVDERQYGQPGGVSLSNSPYVEALIAAGEPALPALIDCLEHDSRFTRSVHFWRDFVPARTVMGVHEACYVAIANILDHDFFEAVATGDDLSSRGGETRARLSGAIRGYMRDVGTLTPAERRLAILRDDRRRPSEWAEAATWVVSRAHPEHESTISLGLGAREEPSMLGESLRASHDAELRRLLPRRARAEVDDDWDVACTLAGAALAWDAELVTSVIPIGRACAASADCPCLGWVVEHMSDRVPHAVEVLADRIVAGGLAQWDLDGLRYASFLELESFQSALGTRLLAQAPSARWAEWGDGAWLLFERRVPAAPEFLRRLLAEPTAIGRLARGENGVGITSMDERSWSSVEVPEGFEGERLIRVRDHVASALGPHLSVPFSLGWTDAVRDEAIARMVAALDASWRAPPPPPPRVIPMWEIAIERPPPDCGSETQPTRAEISSGQHDGAPTSR